MPENNFASRNLFTASYFDGCHIFVDVFPNLLCMSEIISNDKNSKLFITHFITSAQKGSKTIIPKGVKSGTPQGIEINLIL